MNRVQLVVTGRCERDALHKSLEQLFPECTFDIPVMVDSFTSTPLTDPAPHGVLSNLDKLAKKLIELVDEHEDALVVGVDDLELDQAPDRVTGEVRAAVQRMLQDERIASSLARQERLARKLAERCSFHLLAPMLEAYFFGEAAALVRAGVRAEKPSRFDARANDLEEFDVDDPAFLAPLDVEDKHDWRRGGAARQRASEALPSILARPGRLLPRDGPGRGSVAVACLDRGARTRGIRQVWSVFHF